jgi:hypothetical protein
VHLQLYSLRARVGITCVPLRRLIQNPGLHAQLRNERVGFPVVEQQQ